MGKKYLVRLTDEQRAALEERFAEPLTLRQRNRIQVLLRSAAGETDADIADELGISSNTVTNARKRFAAEGLEPALTEKPRTAGRRYSISFCSAVSSSAHAWPNPANSPAARFSTTSSIWRKPRVWRT